MKSGPQEPGRQGRPGAQAKAIISRACNFTTWALDTCTIVTVPLYVQEKFPSFPFSPFFLFGFSFLIGSLFLSLPPPPKPPPHFRKEELPMHLWREEGFWHSTWPPNVWVTSLLCVYDTWACSIGLLGWTRLLVPTLVPWQKSWFFSFFFFFFSSYV
jgi:hypothetical protein